MWYQLQIEQCLTDEAELLSDALEETGALSVTLTDKNDNPVLEPDPGTTPLWPEIIVEAVYAEENQALQAKKCLEEQYLHLKIRLHSFADKNWERVWMDDFKPQRFGQRLWICPSWLTPPDPDAVNLILDPGLAFGTGTHPTTSLCLQWLDQADLTNNSLIDYGCGSGILALAALKLGAKSVHAIDIDPQALEATQNNAQSNAIAGNQLTMGFPESPTASANIVIANILLAPLISLRNTFKSLLNEQGILVVSGILEEQAGDLIRAYQECFLHEQTIDLNGWSLLTFKIP